MVRKGGIPWNKGIPCSQEVKAKIGLGRTGKLHSEDSKNKIRAARALQIMPPHTEEFKQAMSLRQKGKKRGSTPAQVAANKIRNLGKKFPEHSKRMQGNTYARGNRGKKQDPELVKKRITATSKFFEQWPRKETSLEKKLYELLDRAGYAYQKQKVAPVARDG